MISGDAELRTESDLKHRIWLKPCTMYYPGGPDDPDYTIISLKPRLLRGWGLVPGEPYRYPPGDNMSIYQGRHLISRIHQVSGRIFSRILREKGTEELNPAQGRIMFVLRQEDGIPITTLAKRTSMGKSTLTTMLDRLEERGFIKRSPAPEDRRKIPVYRTEKDRSFQEKYTAVSEEMNRLFYRGFSHDEKLHFESCLQRIPENHSG